MQSSSVRVLLEIPGDPAYFGLLRSTVATVSAKRDFTLEAIDDLRMMVDEAANVLHDLEPGAPIKLDLESGDLISVRLSVETTSTHPPTDSLAWTVLDALAEDLETNHDGSRLSLTLHAAGGVV